MATANKNGDNDEPSVVIPGLTDELKKNGPRNKYHECSKRATACMIGGLAVGATLGFFVRQQVLRFVVAFGSTAGGVMLGVHQCSDARKQQWQVYMPQEYVPQKSKPKVTRPSPDPEEITLLPPSSKP
eukprot:TRINITY_DN3572_c0_g1_i2.p1 TRINITY_DN3572_c0_g1~~TRINITY_DN3572_c0_g1_i2.p1  ORF type:complete len:144 (-),score=36.55 TRINITY_DN3572_c0_g1_i2:59-442(-)